MNPSVRAALPRASAVVVAVLAALLFASLAATADAAKPKPREVSVMTRNVYLGASLTEALNATNTTELAVAGQEIWDDVAENDFPARAKLLAREIAQKKPDLVGLQELALWRYDPPAEPGGNGDGPETPAREVRYDFLKLLRKQLDRQDADYRVVRVQREADIEAPLLPAQFNGDGGDGRLTMRDAILARKGAGIEVLDTDSDNFDQNLEVQVGGPEGGQVTVFRGWESAKLNVRGNRFNFVNTHLEAFDNTAKLAQAQELVAPGGPADLGKGGKLPTILLGDLNSDDEIVERLGDTENHQNDELPYAAITEEGFIERSPDMPGLEDDILSCCVSGSVIDSENPPSEELTHVVDHVMVSDSAIRMVAAAVTGRTARTPSGLWASDHMGVFSKLKFPRR